MSLVIASKGARDLSRSNLMNPSTHTQNYWEAFCHRCKHTCASACCFQSKSKLSSSPQSKESEWMCYLIQGAVIGNLSGAPSHGQVNESYVKLEPLLNQLPNYLRDLGRPRPFHFSDTTPKPLSHCVALWGGWAFTDWYAYFCLVLSNQGLGWGHLLIPFPVSDDSS